MDLGLIGKVVAITGGSDGLGLATARTLLGEGARVAICARNVERLQAAAEDLGARGEVLAVPADVRQAGDIRRFVAATVQRFGRLDALVNNAGTRNAGPLADTPDEVWRDDLDLKVMAAVRASREAAAHLGVNGGAIVNILAISAKTPAANSTPTSVTRAAGLALTKALSKELGPQGIRVNAVLIGLVESGQWRRQAEASGRSLSQVLVGLAAGIPLGRVGKAEELGDLVAFLVSPRGAYISGAGINFDGGLSGAP